MLAVYESLFQFKINSLKELKDNALKGRQLLEQISRLVVSQMGFSDSQLKVIRKIPLTIAENGYVDIDDHCRETLTGLGFPIDMHDKVLQQAIIVRLGHHFRDVYIRDDLTLDLAIGGFVFNLDVANNKIEIVNESGQSIINNEAENDLEIALFKSIEFLIPKMTMLNVRLEGLSSVLTMNFEQLLKGGFVNYDNFKQLGSMIFHAIGIDSDSFNSELRLLISNKSVASNAIEEMGYSVLQEDSLQWLDMIVGLLKEDGIDPSVLILTYIESFECQLSKKWVNNAISDEEYIQRLTSSHSFAEVSFNSLNQIRQSPVVEQLLAIKLAKDLEQTLDNAITVDSDFTSDLQLGLQNSL